MVMEQEQAGVNVPIREIYDLQVEMSRTLQGIQADVEYLKKMSSETERADERSREALKVAETAEGKAEYAVRKAKGVERTQNKIGWTIIAAMVTGTIGVLFYFVQKGIGG